MMRIDADDMPELKPLFDPMAFQEEYNRPKLEDWMMDEKQLALSGELATQIRKKIMEKAKETDANLPDEQTTDTN